jgi:hypothetical protein
MALNPNTGQDVEDQRVHAEGLGTPLRLKLEVLS